jgi:hypothetical protein
VLAGVADQVPDDEEVRREPHVGDDPQLVGQALDDVVAQGAAPALTGALHGEVLEVLGVGGVPLREGEPG